MKKYHLYAIHGRPETWCGRKSDNTVKRFDENTLDNACKVCQTRSCEDCGGTGIRGGGTVGIYCGCEWDPEYDLGLEWVFE